MKAFSRMLLKCKRFQETTAFAKRMQQWWRASSSIEAGSSIQSRAKQQDVHR
jgi:hypothetical protein